MGARVIDKASKGGPALDLELAVAKDPDALLFKGEERFAIRAWACADCGYTELYTGNAGAAYKIAQGDAEQRHAPDPNQAATHR